MISLDDRARRALGYRRRYREQGRCSACGRPADRPGRRTCQACADRNATYEKERARRLAPEVRGPNSCGTCGAPGHNRRSCPGLPRLRSDSPPRPCARCSALTAPGQALCPGHIQTLAELAAERAVGRGIDIEDGGDE